MIDESIHTQRHVADALFELLYNYGIRKVFGIPGDELELFDALCYSKLSFITTRHEQGAAFMASAMGKIGPLPGVCISTLGPGATNLVTGVADAYQNRIPLIVLSGQLEKKSWQTSSLPHQYIDLQALFSPITKAALVLTEQKELLSVFSYAFEVALSDRPGPVHITLPADVMEELYEYSIPKVVIPKQNGVVYRNDFSKIQKLLSQSSFPLIFFGQLGQYCDPNVREEIRKSRIPVVTSFLGKGSFPESDSLSLGTISRHIKDSLSKVIDKADLILCIGFDTSEGVSLQLFQGKKVILIDVVDSESQDELQISTKIICNRADVSSTIRDILQDFSNTTMWDSTYLQDIKNDRYSSFKRLYNYEESLPFSPLHIIEALAKIRTGNEIIISDVGIHKQVLGLGYRVENPFAIHFSNGLSSMGFSLPFAAGLRFTTPREKCIISINGDGGFLMNVQELETIQRYNLDIKIIIFVDNAFGMIKANLFNKYKRVQHLDFTNPDYALLAESFHLSFFCCKKPQELQSILKSFLYSSGPALLPLPIKYF